MYSRHTHAHIYMCTHGYTHARVHINIHTREGGREGERKEEGGREKSVSILVTSSMILYIMRSRHTRQQHERK